ncbi:hypothetical protein [Fulvimarina sp. MAC8]|uniref:hypothetical protein n=1 Tax=Fulvimarina sp. MAC8 TaxID=3162874 RepID=UPI0032EDB26E
MSLVTRSLLALALNLCAAQSLAEPVDLESVADVYVRTNGAPPQIGCWVDSTLVTADGLLLDKRAPVGEPMPASSAFACRESGDATVCLQGSMNPATGGFSLADLSQSDGPRLLTASPDGGLRLCAAGGGSCTDYRRCPKDQASAMPGVTDAKRRAGPKTIEINETLFAGLPTASNSAGEEAAAFGSGSIQPDIYGLVPLNLLGEGGAADPGLVQSFCASPFLVSQNSILATTLRRGEELAVRSLVQCSVVDGTLACRDTGRERSGGYFLRPEAAKPRFVMRAGGADPVLCNPQDPSNKQFCHALLSCPGSLGETPIANLDGTTLMQFVVQPPEIRP